MTGSNSHHPGASSGAGTRARDRRAALRRKPDYFMRSGAARIAATCWVVLALPGALAQTGPTLIGIGATLSMPGLLAQIAPGDIVTLQVVGLKTVLPAPVKATRPPLPTVLAGISVLMTQPTIHPGLPVGPPVAVPLFSIGQTRICYGESPPAATPDCMLTSITIQVPSLSYPGPSLDVAVEISENGVGSKTFRLGVSGVDIHVLTACSGGCDALCGAQECPAVTHADGSLVTAASPAKPGEVVVIYATGLGFTDPPVSPGQATPAPAPVARGYFPLQFDFNPNARPRYPDRSPFREPFFPTPEFVGLTPGQIGLYQMNVRIPDTIPPVPPCRVDRLAGASVVSNLTISVGTGGAAPAFYNSLDGAAICVEPPQ